MKIDDAGFVDGVERARSLRPTRGNFVRRTAGQFLRRIRWLRRIALRWRHLGTRIAWRALNRRRGRRTGCRRRDFGRLPDGRIGHHAAALAALRVSPMRVAVMAVSPEQCDLGS